jgi:hypothetical protein
MVFGTKGFIAWFEVLIYRKLRNASKNIYVKIAVHTIGVLLIITGIYFVITTIPSLASIAGLFLIIIGLVIFVIPLGVE